MAEKHDYRQIFKATGLFGSVQVFNILIGFARNKVVAVLLGKEGMGFSAMLNLTLSIINSITNMGLGYSAVRNISQATESGNLTEFSRTAITFKRWMWFSGLLGTVITLALSPMLSQWTFGTKDYTASFIWLAATFIINSQAIARNTMLQGMRKLQLMARSNVFGSVVGLCISLPLYYFFGMEGIVPAMIITAISGFLISWYLTRNIEVQPLKLTLRDSFFQGRDMVKLGIMTTLSAAAWNAANYLVNAYISHTPEGLGDVGLYQSAHSITNQTVNLVFTAMIVDFYPRLSAIHHDILKVRQTVNQQVEIATLLITPLILAFVAFLPLVVRILYTPEFMPIILYIKWYFLGILFKVTYWSLGYIFMAKGDTRLYLMVELSSCLIFLLFAVAGYTLFGLEGLGASYLVAHLLFCVIYYTIVRKRYGFRFNNPFFILITVQMLLAIGLFVAVEFWGFPYATFVGVALFILSALFSFREISKRIALKEVLAEKFKRFKKQ